MKKLLLLIFLSLPLFSDIDSQIEAIQRAPVSERFKLMNAFKKEIVQMQEKERIQAMTKLKSITQSKYADKAFKDLHSRTRNTKIRREQENQTEQDSRIEPSDTEESVENEVENEAEESAENEVENEAEESVEQDVEQQTDEHIEREDYEENEHEEEEERDDD